MPGSDDFCVGDDVMWLVKSCPSGWTSPSAMLKDSDVRNRSRGEVLSVATDTGRQRVVLKFLDNQQMVFERAVGSSDWKCLPRAKPDARHGTRDQLKEKLHNENLCHAKKDMF